MNAASVIADVVLAVETAGLGYVRSTEAFDFQEFRNLEDRHFQLDPGEFTRTRSSRACVNYLRELLVHIAFSIRSRDQFATIRDTMVSEEESIALQLEVVDAVRAIEGSYSKSPDGKWLILTLSVGTDYEVGVPVN